MGARNRSIAERLSDGSMPITECGCQVWLGALSGRMGYGNMKVAGRVETTHRLSWQEANGRIPKGLFVLHRCDIPSCINPDHLFLGDHDANMADKKSKRRAPHGAAHHRQEVSPEMAAEIKASSKPVVELAEKFGLPYGTVWQIRNNKRWKYMEAHR